MYACMTVVSGLPMGRRRSRVAPKSGAHARVARLRQRLGGGDSRKTVGGGVSRRYLHPTHLQRSHLHAHSAHRTSRTRVTLVAPVEWRARGPAVKSQGDRREGAEAMAWQSQPSHRLRWHSSQRLHAGGGVTPPWVWSPVENRARRRRERCARDGQERQDVALESAADLHSAAPWSAPSIAD